MPAPSLAATSAVSHRCVALRSQSLGVPLSIPMLTALRTFAPSSSPSQRQSRVVSVATVEVTAEFDVEDIEVEDPVLARSLRQLVALQPGSSEEAAALAGLTYVHISNTSASTRWWLWLTAHCAALCSFAVMDFEGGEVELVPGGAGVPVSTHNKPDYVRAVARYALLWGRMRALAEVAKVRLLAP